MNQVEKRFVSETVTDEEGLKMIQRFSKCRIPFLVVLNREEYCLYPLGPGDRVYIRSIEQEDLLIVHLVDDEEAVLRTIGRAGDGGDKT